MKREKQKRVNKRINNIFLKILAIILLSHSCLHKEEEKVKERIIAIVNDEAITETEYLQEKGLNSLFQMKTSTEELNILKRNILGKLIDKKILLNEARRKNIYVTDQEVDAEIAKIKSDFPENRFENLLKENAIPYDVWRNKLKESLTIQKLLQNISETSPKISEEEIYVYYKSHPEDFKNINKIQLRQILLQDAKVAQEVKNRLAKGEDFVKLVTEFSIGYEKKNGGLLPLLSKEELPVELEEAFKLRPGQVLGPIKTDYGYHIVRVEKKIVKKKIKLNEAKGMITEILKREKINKGLNEYLTALRKNARIEIKAPELLGGEEK